MSFRRLELFKALFFAMIILFRRFKLNKETRQAAISRVWRTGTDAKQLNFAAPTSDRQEMSFLPSLKLSSILPEFTEKRDPEVARAAFSTWSVQNSRPGHLKYAVSWSQLPNRLPHGVFKTPFTVSLRTCSSLNFLVYVSKLPFGVG